MAGTKRWAGMLVAAGLMAASQAVVADNTPAYKCMRGGTVTYSQAPCSAASKPLGENGKPRVNVRYEAPPQDRAKAARRAQLSEEARGECTALEGTMRAQEGQIKAKGDALTLQDEMPLVHSKKRFRELGC